MGVYFDDFHLKTNVFGQKYRFTDTVGCYDVKIVEVVINKKDLYIDEFDK